MTSTLFDKFCDSKSLGGEKLFSILNQNGTVEQVDLKKFLQWVQEQSEFGESTTSSTTTILPKVLKEQKNRRMMYIVSIVCASVAFTLIAAFICTLLILRHRALSRAGNAANSLGLKNSFKNNRPRVLSRNANDFFA